MRSEPEKEAVKRLVIFKRPRAFNRRAPQKPRRVAGSGYVTRNIRRRMLRAAGVNL